MSEYAFRCPACGLVWYYVMTASEVREVVPNCPKCNVELEHGLRSPNAG